MDGEGILVAEDSSGVDPVSGNPIPPGGSAEEVRDDIPAKLSDNEYVIPADVVKMFGVKYFEGIVKRGKKMMEELDAEGRINGKAPQEILAEDELGMNEEEDDFPFSLEELQVEEIPEDQPEMFVGGLVTAGLGLAGKLFGRKKQESQPHVPQKSMFDMDEQELGSYVQRQQDRAGLFSALGGVAGAVLGGGGWGSAVSAGLAKLGGDLRPLAVTNAAQKVAEEKGFDKLAEKLREHSSKIEEGLSPLGKVLDGYFATGNKIFEHHQQYRSQREPQQAPQAPQVSPSKPVEVPQAPISSTPVLPGNEKENPQVPLNFGMDQGGLISKRKTSGLIPRRT